MGAGTARFKEGMYISGSAHQSDGSDSDFSLVVSGSIKVESGAGSQPGITFQKGEDDIHFIRFAADDDGTSSNATLTYQQAEHIFIQPGRGGDFYIQARTTESSDPFTFPFSVMDNGTARFEKGLSDTNFRSTNLADDVAFFVSGSDDNLNNAVFGGDVVVSGTLEVGDIDTTSNRNINLDPNGSGVVVFKGNATKGAGQFKLNCENNSHGITIKGPPHSAAASYTLTLPNNDGNNNQVLKTDGAGVLSWTDPSSGNSVLNTLNDITNASGEVIHDCTNSNFFYHTSIAGNFTPNFTNLNMQNNQITEGSLILTQGGTGYLPEAFKVDSTGSNIYWEWPGAQFFTASINKTDTIDFKITKRSDTYNIFARFSNTIFAAAPSGGGGGGVSIPSNCLLFLDASDTNSYNGSGTTWTDLSSNSNNGTLVNSPTWNGTNKLFEFAGEPSDQHVTLPTGFADFTNGATWFFVADLGNGQHWERLVDFSVGGDEINVGRNQSTNNMTLEYYNPSKQRATSNNIILNNTLANYVVTTDGNYAKFYRNGSLITDISYTMLPSNAARSQNYIGKSRGQGADYEGEIAVVAIFNRALTASEITNLYNHYNAIYSF